MGGGRYRSIVGIELQVIKADGWLEKKKMASDFNAIFSQL